MYASVKISIAKEAEHTPSLMLNLVVCVRQFPGYRGIVIHTNFTLQTSAITVNFPNTGTQSTYAPSELEVCPVGSKIVWENVE